MACSEDLCLLGGNPDTFPDEACESTGLFAALAYAFPADRDCVHPASHLWGGPVSNPAFAGLVARGSSRRTELARVDNAGLASAVDIDDLGMDASRPGGHPFAPGRLSLGHERNRRAQERMVSDFAVPADRTLALARNRVGGSDAFVQRLTSMVIAAH